MYAEEQRVLVLQVADLQLSASIINEIVWDLLLQVADLHEQLIEAGDARDRREHWAARLPVQRSHRNRIHIGVGGLGGQQ